MLTGFTSSTPTNLQLDAGVFLTSYTPGQAISEANVLGATRGGGTFSAIPTIHQIAVDGVPTNWKGGHRVDEWVSTIRGTMLELSEATIKKALGPGATVETITSSNNKKIVVRSNSVDASDYADIWWVGSLSSGENVAIRLKNAISLAGFTLTFADRGEGTFPIELTANYDMTDASARDEAPFEIIYEHSA